jgi:signal transduction histidine kinase
VRESLRDELGARYAVDVATCGREAMGFLSTARFDAVISDLRMPDLSGIQVLEAARAYDAEVVRILLTGHLDEEAREATLDEGAPFKVGKPWHDELEVTLRRAFEQRDRERKLTAALSLGALDDELAAQDGLAGIAGVLVRRARELEAASAIDVVVCAQGQERTLSGFAAGDQRASEWRIDEPLTADCSVRVRASGRGGAGRRIVTTLVERARRWSIEDGPTRLARGALADETARRRLVALAGRAALGTLSGAISHELASVIQCVSSAIDELGAQVHCGASPAELAALVDEAHDFSQRAIALFSAMRTLVHPGSQRRQRVQVAEVVARAGRLCQGYVRSRGLLRIDAAEEAPVEADEPLLVQVFVNLLRNAADASPGIAAAVDVALRVEGGRAIVTVTDDGPGVAEEHRAQLFQPFFTTKEVGAGTGLGLALAAQVVHDHRGELAYRPAPGRGACFEVVLPLAG